MKILLCKDVESLGYLGDVVEVKNGYARNYLLPQGVGIVPTKSNIKSLADAKAAASAERRVAHDRLATVVEAVEHGVHHVELGRQDFRVFLHVGLDALEVLEEARMTQLIQLVGADRHFGQMPLHPRDIPVTARHGAHPHCAGKHLLRYRDPH